MALITAKDLTLGYENRAVVKGLDFEVESGDYLCIVGENGSGKTTLMRTLLGLQEPLSGEVLFGDGVSKNEIGYLPQQSLVQKDFPATVGEIVLSGCAGSLGKKFFYGKKEKQKAAENMKRMEIEDLKNRCFRELSGGQQQRVLLARALCAAEKILLLDEPVSGLDPKVTAEMYSEIKKLSEGGITIIMISHDIESCIRYATRILHLGDNIFFGSKEEYARSRMGKAFISEGGAIA